jgi:shikimate dehydrogenase
MQINNDTKLVTLLGKPVAQSYSTRLQNFAYNAKGLNLVYLAEEVDKEHLGDVIQGLRHMNFAGSAVTKPDKVAVMQYLDGADELCEKIGACNTIVNQNGSLIGYNTDAAGFYEFLAEDGGVRIENASFFCFGAGGVARAMCAALAFHGAGKIYVTDYFESCAEDLCRDLNEKFPPVFEFVHYGDCSKVPECDVVLNASGVGMGSSMGTSPLPKEYIRSHQLYFDACYNPDKTQFLLDAEMAGAKILNGLGMFIRQGAAQIQYWTGIQPPVEEMRQELLRILKE